MGVVCKICKKEYASYASRSNHIKNYHTKPLTNCKETALPCQDNVKTDTRFPCSHCKKEFNSRQGKWYHEQRCDKIDKNNNELLNKINMMEKEIEKLKSEKSKPKISKNINNNSHNNINNGNIINLNIVAPGKEKLDLTNNEITSIFEKKFSGVVKFIEFLNFNKNRPNNHSFCVTNREGKHLLKYNPEKLMIESDKKRYFYINIIENALFNMEKIFMANKSKFTKEKQFDIYEGLVTLKQVLIDNHDDKTLKKIYDELNLLCYNSRKTILDSWNIMMQNTDSSMNHIECTTNKEKSSEEMEEEHDSEDYKKYFIPLSDVIEIYNNDIMNKTVSDESTSSIHELIIRKKQKPKQINI
jgi:hypothetical protein